VAREVTVAAHVRQVTQGGEHRLDNGLLLRSDVHTLFDRGYLGIDSGYRLRVSPRLREEFANGDQYYARAGQVSPSRLTAASGPNSPLLKRKIRRISAMKL
jgi:putative restriction endonuclease